MNGSILVRTGSGRCQVLQGKKQCRVSVLSFCFCLTRNNIDQLSWHLFAAKFYSDLGIRKIRTVYFGAGNRRYCRYLNSVPGGVRNQLSSERFIIFVRTEITWILWTTRYSTTAALYLPSCQGPHTHAEVAHLSTASCTYCQRRLCRRNITHFTW